jgi:hypothetical protein
MHHANLFRQRIRAVRQLDPGARIVVVGFSTGANCVRKLAHELKEDGVRLDLLVYLGGDTIRNAPQSRPENAANILNINGHGMVFHGRDLFFCGEDLDGAWNHRLDARHMTLPSRAETAELLVQYLAAIAQQLPANQGPWP